MIAYYKFVFNRNNRPLKAGQKSLVQLRMTMDRQARYFSTGIRIEKYQWSGRDGTWIINHDAANEYNAFLWEILSRVQRANALAEIDARSLSYESVKHIVRYEADLSSFIEFMERDIADRGDITDSTKKKARSAINKLTALGITKFADLTYENILRAHNEMLKIDRVATVDKFHAIIGTYIRRAIRMGLMPMDKNPYNRFKRQRPKEGDRKYLTKEEFAKLETKELPIERLNFVRDIFVFCCYTGLSYSDLQNLTPTNIITDKNKFFIKISRQKTQEGAVIFLLAKAKAILDKYAGRRDGFSFPSISNQKMNAYLKEISTICGIEKDLTAHVARHTFATTIMLSNGVSLEVTQKALGHSNIRTTQIYAKLLNDRLASEMEVMEKKLN